MQLKSLGITCLFLAITVASSLKIAGTLGYYALFTEDFIERYCENKERPELQCDGKCALSKMLAQKKQEEREPINLDWLKTETILFLENVSSVGFETFPIVRTNKFRHINLYRFRYIQHIVIPPWK
ncbi:hypothetical protein [Maribacter aurantiacus]|uniref:Uncharacterized protein n=1 Tax=Maribacter aurantiacus TaxID=1882343 RepID=A0A5R8M6K4_9FLAO|nr:hypothetical protein [Maribacter aurantiacus]TLF44399.1 hypothetical protein FEK29_11315 [Maribacter aurantiacus]